MSRNKYRKRYSQPPARDSLPPSTATSDYSAVAIGTVLILSLTCCASGGAYMLYQRFDGEMPIDEPIADNDPAVDETPAIFDPDSPTPPSQDPVAAMRPRYRPGPHVTVQGLLPGGLTNQARMGSPSRNGHTIDNPWIVPGSSLEPANAPRATPGAGPTIRLNGSSSEPLHVIAGAPADLRIDARSLGDSGIRGVYVYFEGYPGHFYVPSVVDTELGQVRVTGDGEALVRFGIDAPVTPQGNVVADDKPLDATMHIAAVDEENRVSAYLTRQLRVMPVGTGDLEVTLSMTKATDLDLYVVDPTGTTISYQNRNSIGGGQLDLDANAGCSSNMGVNTEHVFWATGSAPAGAYQVRVSNFSSCINDQRVDYTITVRNCGETAVFAGHFEGPESGQCDARPEPADRGSCQHVVDFDVTPCPC